MKRALRFQKNTLDVLLSRIPVVASREQSHPSPLFRSLKLECLEDRNLLSGMGDDFGDTFQDAEQVVLSVESPLTLSGTIEEGRDRDVFRFESPVSGPVTLHSEGVPSSNLEGFIEVVSKSGSLTSPEDQFIGDVDFPGTNETTFELEQGQVYLIRVGAFGFSEGGYAFTLTTPIPKTDDFGDTLADAEPIQLSADVPLVLGGTIEVSSDMDSFQFVAPLSGVVTIRQVVFPGNNPLLMFASDDINIPFLYTNLIGRESELSFPVEQAQTYFAQVVGDSFLDSVGDYLLSFSLDLDTPDDFGDTFEDAEPIELSVDVPVTLNGAIESNRDSDMFRFVAPTSGTVTVSHGSDLDSFFLLLAAYDVPGSPLVATSPGEDTLNFSVVQEQTYFLQAFSGLGFSQTSSYVLTFGLTSGVSDDFGDTFEDAEPIELSVDAPVTRNGAIESNRDSDMFRFVASASGKVTVTQKADSGSNPLKLSLFDDSLDLLDATTNNVLTFFVEQGSTYFLQVSPGSSLAPGAVGYSLALSLADRFLLPAAVVGSILPQGQESFNVRLTQPGQLRIQARGEGFPVRVSLLDRQGRLLIQSQQQFAEKGEALLVQHLEGDPEGTEYVVRVEGADGQGGSYELFTTFIAGPSPFRPFHPFPVQGGIGLLASDDFDNDGHLDQVVSSLEGLSLFLGLGDGSFRKAIPIPAETIIFGLAVGNFNDDQHPDLVLDTPNGLSVFLGLGDGTFQQAGTLPPAAGFLPSTMVPFDGILPVDFNNDGFDDVATSSIAGLSVHLGMGDGHFQRVPLLATGDNPHAITSGDFNGDQLPDLAFTTFAQSVVLFTPESPGHVSVLLGQGDGTFRDERQYRTGEAPESVAVGDFNADGHTDLVTGNSQGLDLSVFFGLGDGTFQEEKRFELGEQPFSVKVVDVNSDRFSDLVVETGVGISVLLGIGDGTFLQERQIDPLGRADIGDFNSDGTPDLTVASPEGVSVLLGLGDGSFEDKLRFETGGSSLSLTSGDFNGDGRLDLLDANFITGDVSVLLGLGDGTFQDEVRFQTGINPESLALGDFNRDGRIDLVAANPGSSDVSVLLGLGDGTFQDELRSPTGEGPQSVVLGDFNKDGHLDLVTINLNSSDVSVLLGLGDGTFQDERRFLAGDIASSMAVGDFNGDGNLDLATASVQGGFSTFPALPDETSSGVSVLLGLGDGTFQDERRFRMGNSPTSLTLGDVNNDGHVDLVTANAGSNDVSVSLGLGDGTFQDELLVFVGDLPNSVVLGDFNDDGRLDLATYNIGTTVSVLLGFGEEFAFASPDTFFTGIRSQPLLADLDGDETEDVAVLDRKGQIHIRYARTDQPGVLDAPTVILANARDLAVLPTSRGPVFASLDATGSQITIHSPRPGEAASVSQELALPLAEAGRLEAGDVDHDGRVDLVAATVSGKVFVSFQQTSGAFGPIQSFEVGTGPADVVVTNVDGQLGSEILTANTFSGDVSILHPLTGLRPAFELRSRSGQGLYGLTSLNGEPVVQSRERPVSLTVGRFDDDGFLDVIVLNSGSRSLSLLRGALGGGLLPPQEVAFLAGVERATSVLTADFNNDSHLDLAVLEETSETILVFLGDGLGKFNPVRDGQGQPLRVRAGNVPTGMSVTDVDRDGNADLVVGNEFGDVLTLLGNGDGTFRPFIRPGQAIPFVTNDFNNDGLTDVLVTNPATDEAAVLLRQDGASFRQGAFSAGREEGLQGPVAPTLVDLNQDGRQDMVFANSGSNTIVAVLVQADGSFDSRSFFVGTNPVGITVEDLNADGIPDLSVANEGSNDVSILLGQVQGEAWTFTPGPRLNAGGQGPVSVEVRDQTGDSIPDLLVTNGQDGTITVLPGIGTQAGTGFFDDTAPQTLNIPTVAPPAVVPPVVNVTPEVIVTNTGAVVARSNLTPIFIPEPTQSGAQAADLVDNVLVTALRDGSVSVFTQSPGGGFTPAQVFNNPVLSNPTNVQLVPVSTGFDIFVTQPGSSTPFLFSFRFSDPSLSSLPNVGNPDFPRLNEGSGLGSNFFTITFEDGVAGDDLTDMLEEINRVLAPEGLDNPPSIDLAGGIAIPDDTPTEGNPSPNLEPATEGGLGLLATPGQTQQEDASDEQARNASLLGTGGNALDLGLLIGPGNPSDTGEGTEGRAIAGKSNQDQEGIQGTTEGGAANTENTVTLGTTLLRDLYATWVSMTSLLVTAGDRISGLFNLSEKLSTPAAITASVWEHLSEVIEQTGVELDVHLTAVVQQTGETLVSVAGSLSEAVTHSLVAVLSGEVKTSTTATSPFTEGEEARQQTAVPASSGAELVGELSPKTNPHDEDTKEGSADLVFAEDRSSRWWLLLAPLLASLWKERQVQQVLQRRNRPGISQ